MTKTKHFSKVTFIFLLAIISNLILAAILPNVERWGSEMARIAASISSGQGFSSPFLQPTGPTAWEPPVFPYVIAGIFYVFGAFTAGAYWVAMLLNIVVHALTCVLLYRVAGEVFGERAGWYSACALASLPLLSYPLVLLHVLGNVDSGLGLFISPSSIWSMQFTELAILIVIWATLHPPHWLAYGLIWGGVALLNPSVLAFSPALLAWQLWQRQNWRYMSLTIAAAALCIAPWLIRDYLVFHRPIFIRDNFGLELKVGNQPGGMGLWCAAIHPDRNAEETKRMAAIGEIEYCRLAGQEAMQLIRSRPGEFAYNTVLRIKYFWFGPPLTSHRLHPFKFLREMPQTTFCLLTFFGAFQVLRGGNRQGLLFVAVLLFFPLVYYITHSFLNYQTAIHPVMLALATSALLSLLGQSAGEVGPVSPPGSAADPGPRAQM